MNDIDFKDLPTGILELESPAIHDVFEMFSKGAMNPKKYVPKQLPKTVTVTLPIETMEILHVISSRIGTTRAVAAAHILQIGAIEAATGCGFTVDEKGNIPKDQKKWDSTVKTTGFAFITDKDED
mgnify:CR=1 FL=1